MSRPAAVAAVLVLACGLHASAHAESPAAGTDFAPQVQAMFRIAACGSADALPARLADATTARAITRHCTAMAALYASYKRAWADQAGAFIATLRPADLPTTVVYPFGGGDLTSALVVFPQAAEVTTISLEAPGDVRAIDAIAPGVLAGDLTTIAHDVRRLYRAAHSTTKSLQAASHSQLPGTLMFALAALAVHAQEPVSLRYFDLQPDGSLAYLTSAQLDQRLAEYAAVKHAKRSSKHTWFEQDSPLGNVEIQFRPRGAAGPVRTYRHIVANLDDAHQTADGRVLAHLRMKGTVAAMTKAASFLLWRDDFSQVRQWLIASIAWMISDASGLPPADAAAAGLAQTTYGAFTGPYFIKDANNVRAQMAKLWRSQPTRPLPFRFGYPDETKQNHLMVTQPKPR